jgi:hypothetical protein
VDDKAKLAIDAVKCWQDDKSLHPLTCPGHSNVSLTAKICGKKAVLTCGRCSYMQEWIPDVVFEHYAREGGEA